MIGRTDMAKVIDSYSLASARSRVGFIITKMFNYKAEMLPDCKA
jgi:hypothetical protein